MRAVNPGELVLSATDLSAFAACRHRTGLDLAVALGLLLRPKWSNPASAALIDRGKDHERKYVDQLRTAGCTVVDLTESEDRVDATRQALRAGVDVIVQGALECDGWFGYPDVLVRVDRPSALGDWSYEAHDTKLARETRGSAILQLALYSELLGEVQAVRPARFCVVTPDPIAPVQSYRLDDYAAYVRLMRARLAETVGRPVDEVRDETYPEPVEHCDICRWQEECEQRRRDDDHLSFIAGATRLHREELEARGVTTLAAAAQMPVPVPFKPSRGSRDAYTRIREQARVQFQQRESRKPVWELLDAPCAGLLRMPEPSPGDVFLDLEGARFAREGGREYLFGLWSGGTYRCWWATTDAEERSAFEAVMDAIAEAWNRDPAMHVYHFGHYEVTAFKRLAGRYAVKAEELDHLLRADRFVDLHRVTRQTLRAGVESYSIKQLEQFYGFRREAALSGVGAWLHATEVALEAGLPEEITPEIKQHVEAYNADDCRSTHALRDWIEGEVRTAALQRGDDLPRPEPSESDASAALSERDQRVLALREQLLAGLDGEPSDPSHPQHARWLLAYLIDWHRREERASWWEYLRVLELEEFDDLVKEPGAIAGVELMEQVEVVLRSDNQRPTGSVINRYRYPQQEVDLGRRGQLMRRGDSPFGVRFGDVVAHDREELTIDVKVKADTPHPDVLFSQGVVPTKDLQASVMRLAEDPDAPSAGLELLHRRPPRLVGDARDVVRTSLVSDGESPVAAAVRIVQRLERSYLAIQGPPGAGKTYAGAQMIRALVRAGKRVGVTAVSHKVICNLLEEVRDQAAQTGETVVLARRGGEDDEAVEGVRLIIDNGEALDAVNGGDVEVLGGTAWLWAKPAAADAVDVLFVDEAGQMSLANVLAVSQAAGSIVLLGDPQQLEQPRKGSHPDGVDVSALQHVIGGAQTMPEELGIFLPETWRLAPSISRFTSEVFYDGRLASREELARQELAGVAPFEGSGLWFVPVEHAGNQNASDEEADAVEAIVERLLASSSHWIDREGVAHPLAPSDFRVVAPYNAHVGRLRARLEKKGVPVGTVDKFQGQEAPVVIYSMASSTPQDAPRGMEFLYSLNRLNVATSRARCAAIIVASPALVEPECRTPRQMQLANALCRFREMAVVL